MDKYLQSLSRGIALGALCLPYVTPAADVTPTLGLNRRGNICAMTSEQVRDILKRSPEEHLKAYQHGREDADCSEDLYKALFHLTLQQARQNRLPSGPCPVTTDGSVDAADVYEDVLKSAQELSAQERTAPEEGTALVERAEVLLQRVQCSPWSFYTQTPVKWNQSRKTALDLYRAAYEYAAQKRSLTTSLTGAGGVGIGLLVGLFIEDRVLQETRSALLITIITSLLPGLAGTFGGVWLGDIVSEKLYPWPCNWIETQRKENQ